MSIINGTPIIASAGGFVASSTAPENKKILWIDTANGGIIKYHNGTAWVAVGAAFS